MGVEMWQTKYDGYYKLMIVEIDLLMEIDSASQLATDRSSNCH